MSGPGIYYPRPLLVVGKDNRSAESLARALELDDGDWRPVCSERHLNGYRVKAAFLDEPGWRVAGHSFLEPALENRVRRLVYVDSTAMATFRSRTRSQAMAAADGDGPPQKVWVPFETDRDPTRWGCDTYTVLGTVIELERYSPDGERITECEGIIAPREAAGRVRFKTRRHDAVERLVRAFQRQDDVGPWVFVAGEVTRIEQTNTLVDFGRSNRNGDIMAQNIPPLQFIPDAGPSQMTSWERYAAEISSQQEARLEEARRQLRSSTESAEQAQAMMELALQMSRNSGMSVAEAIEALNRLQQGIQQVAAGDNTDRIMRDMRAALDEEGKTAKPAKPAKPKPAKLKADFEPKQRKIDLED